jgi:MFS family permease
MSTTAQAALEGRPDAKAAATPADGAWAAALRNSELRGVLGAWTLLWSGDTTWLVTMNLVAYHLGGAGGVGVVMACRQVASAVLAPVLAPLSDRYRRDRVLLAIALTSGVAIAATALALGPGGVGLAAIVVGACIEGVAMTLSHGAHVGLLPQLARRPDELLSANSLTELGTGAALLIGPGLVAIGVALGGSRGPLPIAALTFGAAAVVLALVRGPRPEVPATVEQSLLHVAAAGTRALARSPAARSVIWLMTLGAFALGTLSVYVPALALSTLGLGNSGTVFLVGAIGVGLVCGAAGAAPLLKTRLLFAAPVICSALTGVLVISAAAWLHVAVVLVVFALGGALVSVLNASGNTILQRVVPNDELARVIAVYAVSGAIAIGLGAIIGGALISAYGIATALASTGAVLVVGAAVNARWVGRIRLEAGSHAAQLRALTRVAPFRRIPAVSREAVAAALKQRDTHAGQVIVRQGEPGDNFYVIERGTFTAFVNGRRARVMGAGESFGEIALLHRVPRTASVLSTGEGTLWELSGEAFRHALEIAPAARSAALATAQARLESENPH